MLMEALDNVMFSLERESCLQKSTKVMTWFFSIIEVQVSKLAVIADGLQ